MRFHVGRDKSCSSSGARPKRPLLETPLELSEDDALRRRGEFENEKRAGSSTRRMAALMEGSSPLNTQLSWFLR